MPGLDSMGGGMDGMGVPSMPPDETARKQREFEAYLRVLVERYGFNPDAARLIANQGVGVPDKPLTRNPTAGPPVVYKDVPTFQPRVPTGPEPRQQAGAVTGTMYDLARYAVDHLGGQYPQKTRIYDVQSSIQPLEAFRTGEQALRRTPEGPAEGADAAQLNMKRLANYAKTLKKMK